MDGMQGKTISFVRAVVDVHGNAQGNGILLCGARMMRRRNSDHEASKVGLRLFHPERLPGDWLSLGGDKVGFWRDRRFKRGKRYTGMAGVDGDQQMGNGLHPC